MDYDVDHFIRKYEPIPDDQWITGSYRKDGKCCALGFISDVLGLEAEALRRLFRKVGAEVTSVNDEQCVKYQQATPKGRIMAVLYDVRNLEGEKLDEPSTGA
jgi:hypothetical protein